MNVVGICFVTDPAARALIQGFKLQGGSSGNPLLFARGNGAVLQYEALEFGSVVEAQVRAFSGGQTTRVNNVTISGGATRHLQAFLGGMNIAQSGIGTLIGTPAYSQAFAHAYENGTIRTTSGSWSGAATGPRFLSLTGGGIQAFGGSASLPGNAAGTTTASGWTA